MKIYYIYLLLFGLLASNILFGQKIFVEGTITYSVKIKTEKGISQDGSFVITIKGNKLKKELNLNEYKNTLIINLSNDKAYALQCTKLKKYAIELKLQDIDKELQPYENFNLKIIENSNKKISGLEASKGEITYKDNTTISVYLNKNWAFGIPYIYDRFPNANFLPLFFTFNDENNAIFKFELTNIKEGDIENAVFAIPTDYKIITHEEYQNLK